MLFSRLRIRRHQLGLGFRHGDFVGLLTPGAYWLGPALLARGPTRVEVVDTLGTKFEHPMLDVLVRDPALRERLTVVDLKDDQRALVWKDGRLGWIVGPGRHAFWTEPYDLKVEVFETGGFVFDHPKVEAVLGHPGGARYLEGVRVASHERALLFREGELVDTLGPGMHVFWRQAGKVTWQSVDLREQTADVAGQEIMTGDKVTLRVNLLVTYRVVDPLRAVTSVADYAQAVYRAAQLALRESVGGRKLDQLLADKEQVGAEVRNAIASQAEGYGVAVRGVGLRDVILPGEMKSILNQVILAQKQAEANLVRRREETAAARSQANTAKLLADSPTLRRMKELETLQEVLAGADVRVSLGQGDVLEQVRQLIASADG